MENKNLPGKGKVIAPHRLASLCGTRYRHVNMNTEYRTDQIKRCTCFGQPRLVCTENAEGWVKEMGNVTSTLRVKWRGNVWNEREDQWTSKAGTQATLRWPRRPRTNREHTWALCKAGNVTAKKLLEFFPPSLSRCFWSKPWFEIKVILKFIWMPTKRIKGEDAVGVLLPN